MSPLPQTPRPIQSRAQGTVRRLLDAAGDRIAQRGAVEIDMASLASDAAVSRTAVYRYFPSAKALLRELARRYSDQMSAAVFTDIAALPDADSDAELARDIVLVCLARIRRTPRLPAGPTFRWILKNVHEIHPANLRGLARVIHARLRPEQPWPEDSRILEEAARSLVDSVKHLAINQPALLEDPEFVQRVADAILKIYDEVEATRF